MLFIIYASVTVFTILFAVYMLFWYKNKVKLFDLTEETTGIITKMIKGSFAVSPKPKGQVYNIKVKYTINGIDYKTNMQCEEGDPALSEGQAVTVLYDPKNPSRAIPKDFKREHAEYYWRMLVILSVILCVVAVCVTVFTAPDLLRMSVKKERIYKIYVKAFAVIALPVTHFFVRRTNEYKLEIEHDPKQAKKTFLGGFVVWCNILLSLIFDVVFYVIL